MPHPVHAVFHARDPPKSVVSLAEADVATLAGLHAVSLAELPAATSAKLQMVNWPGL